MSDRPSDTPTFLFTDIEGSTRLAAALDQEWPAVLSTHLEIVERAVTEAGGDIFGTEGDAVFARFGTARQALAAAAAAQRALSAQAWPGDEPLRVRMGIHSGEVSSIRGQLVGLVLHRVARIAAAAHGGQVLISRAASDLASDALPKGATLRDLGEHRLKDLAEPERIFQLVLPDLPSEFPPPRTLDARNHNLPVQLTSFIGREREVAEARRLLAGTRLLTLTGPGGTGKTRLSLQLAADASDDFPDGVWFVPLEAITDPGLVMSEVAATLRVPEMPGASALDRLAEHFAGRRVLLVLDNFEQVVGAAPDVAELVRRLPELSVVVTSRFVLRLAGEQEFPVPPLGVPDPTTPLIDPMAAFEAVRLFVDRAMAARPDFRLNDENAAAVSEIVRRLDGLPLAIELAAARIRVLPPQAIRDRLDRALTLLAGGAGDLPDRQRTLRGAIAWSHDLLGPGERRLFAQLGIFMGGASLEQIEAVCDPPEETGNDILEGVTSLVEKSFLRPGDADGEARFSMLVTIQEFAQEQLDARDDAEQVRRRHAEAYLALAERCAPDLLGPDQRRWLDRLEREHDNIRAALDWAVLRGEAAIALRLAAAVWRFWQFRGHLAEAARRLAEVLELPAAAAPELKRERAAGLAAAGGVAYWRGQHEPTHRYYRQALEVAREIGDERLLAEALYDFSWATTPEIPARTQDLYVQGIQPLSESLAIFRRLGDRSGLAKTLWALANAVFWADRRDEAAAMFYESLDLYRSMDDRFGLGWSLHMVGLLEILSDVPRAAGRFEEALDIFIASDDISAIQLLLLDASAIARHRGDLGSAWTLAGASMRLHEETGTDLVGMDLFEGFGLVMGPPPAEDQAATAAWERGRTLPRGEMIALARETLRAGRATISSVPGSS
ncbi:MAG TPA: AAA family ATPase [Candidatus Limnocylindrales bacterium]|nr:AAA family ATPase [Candidatus Limnocylindrales bacterium]